MSEVIMLLSSAALHTALFLLKYSNERRRVQLQDGPWARRDPNLGARPSSSLDGGLGGHSCRAGRVASVRPAAYYKSIIDAFYVLFCRWFVSLSGWIH